MNINKKQPVAVTGATGYVAGQLIKRLLEEGLTVHATVRNLNDTNKLKYLNALDQKLPGQLVYFEADLLKESSFDEALDSCQIVFHTASPFFMDVGDPQKDLVEPAQLGTRNVLMSASKVTSVKRVVVTSSVAAISGDNIDLQKTANNIFTEDDWNTTSSLHHNPYSYSKTLAEKEAWNIAEKQNQWDLVTINPSLVMGPGINPHASSESFKIIQQIGDGTFKAGMPNWGMGLVDVRDVAEAHIRAAFTETSSGRYIVCGHNTSLSEMVKPLFDKYGKDYPIPSRVLPKFMVWLLGPIANKAMTRKAIKNNVNYNWVADNSKSKSDLGLTYRPLDKTMIDFFEQMIEHKIL